MEFDPENLTLSEVLQASFQHLDDAVHNRKSPMRCPIVATIGDNGPNQRIMVLREFDQDSRVLRFHTDFRSPKVAELEQNDKISILAYDPEKRVQLKIYGTAKIYNEGDKATEAWIQTDTMGRRCYLCEPGSGAKSSVPDSGISKDIQSRRPTIEETEAGRKNFAILLANFHQIEWMYLNSQGNRGASFHLRGNDWSGHWIIP